MSIRNPLKDRVAIVGIGAAPYGRHLKRSLMSLALEACINAINDAGLRKDQIDGICGHGSGAMAPYEAGFLSVQSALGISNTSWVLNGWHGSQFIYAVQAVYAGGCDYCLVLQATRRDARMSRSAGQDLFRQRATDISPRGIDMPHYSEAWKHTGEVYAAWTGKYMRDYSAPPEMLGMIAINNRQWASRNPAAIMREPFGMDVYLSSRMVREPLRVLDMDVPVDAAEAMVITTAERAKDLPHKPVYVHAASLGGTEVGEYYESGLGWGKFAPSVAMQHLWAKSDIKRDDIDIYYPHDGFSANTVAWIEAAGFAELGQTWNLLKDGWDENQQRISLNGRIKLNTGGGSLSHGRMNGFNYYTEGVRQLRGAAGERQIDNARTALFGIGSLYHDPSAVVLRNG